MTNGYKNPGVGRNSAPYNRTALNVVINAIDEVGATFYASRATSRLPQEVEAIIAGTFVGTLALQGAPINTAVDDNTLWATIATYTAPAHVIITCVAPQAIRIKATAWTSGTANTSLIWGSDA